MSWLGDIRLGDTLDLKFTTRQISGAPFTLAGVPVISAYVGNSTTEITAGITLTVDFDARTGLNHVRVVATSGNGFATASSYELVITTGTVNGVSVVGEVIGSFSIENRSQLMPTTAARTLDVTATGEAGLDFTNVLGTITRAMFNQDTGLQSIRSNTAQAGAATTITLDAGASAVNDFYTGTSLLTTGGTGVGQFRIITGYVGATRVATVASAWITQPDATTTFAIFPAAETATTIATEVWNTLMGDGTLTAKQVMRVCLAALAAKLSGAATTTVTIRNVADSANVIVATVDADGNRSAVVVTP